MYSTTGVGEAYKELTQQRMRARKSSLNVTLLARTLLKDKFTVNFTASSSRPSLRSAQATASRSGWPTYSWFPTCLKSLRTMPGWNGCTVTKTRCFPKQETRTLSKRRDSGRWRSRWSRRDPWEYWNECSQLRLCSTTCRDWSWIDPTKRASVSAKTVDKNCVVGVHPAPQMHDTARSPLEKDAVGIDCEWNGRLGSGGQQTSNVVDNYILEASDTSLSKTTVQLEVELLSLFPV